MKVYFSNSNNPFYNLAVEEVLLKFLPTNKDICFFYCNNSSVIIGNNQTTFEEVDYSYIENNQIFLARRLSGGGAVYQDLGNINFSFIKTTNRNKNSQKEFLKPIIAFLDKYGVKAEFKGRNDLIVENKKISGSAQYLYKNKIMHHGTILFDVNTDKATNALTPSRGKIESKGIKSVQQRIINIKPLLNKKMDSKEFFSNLVEKFSLKSNSKKAIDVETLDNELKNKIKIIEKRNRSWDWVFGDSPKFSFSSEKRFSTAELKIKMMVEKGKITSVRFNGDFLSLKNVTEIEDKLIGTKYSYSDIIQVFHLFTFENYFGGITKYEVAKLMVDK